MMKVVDNNGYCKSGLTGPTGPTGPVGSSVAGPTGSTGAGSAVSLTTDDKGLSVSSAISGYAQNTGLQISNVPSGYVATLINGVQYRHGDAVKSSDLFFSGDNFSGYRYDPFLFPAADGLSFLAGGSAYGGTAWTVGLNSSGSVGDNSTTSRSSPVSVVGEHVFVFGSANAATRHGLKSDGTAWGWGSNSIGSVGDNSANDRSSPVSVVGSHSFIRIGSINSGAVCALKASGTAWAWGSNAFGILGNNSTANRSSPTSVVGDHSFINISTGARVFHGLKADGTVWGWGRNSNFAPPEYGQVGDNTLANRSSPVSVVGDHSFIKIGNTGGLKVDGTAWKWGPNGIGQCGDNTNNNRSSPVSVVGDHSFISLSGSYTNNLALKSDGTAWAWGDNSSGRLGDNSTDDRSSPVSVVGEHSFIKTVMNDDVSVGVKADGSFWSWGSSPTGDNTTQNRSSPVSVVINFSFLPTPRASDGVQASDYLYWNSSIAGFDLEIDDRIDLNYIEE